MTNATTPSRSSRSTGTTTGGGPGAPSASGSSSAAAGSASAATYADAAAAARAAPEPEDDAMAEAATQSPLRTHAGTSLGVPAYLLDTPVAGLAGPAERGKLRSPSGEILVPSVPLPSAWNSKDKCSLLQLTNGALTVNYNGTGKNDSDAAAVRANHPMHPSCGVYYFEIDIVSKGRDGYIGIGFSHAGVSTNRLPGWEPGSWGYHGDDGHSFACYGTGKPYGPTFTTGDVIGCGVNFVEGNWSAFFTKNGLFLGVAFRDLRVEPPANSRSASASPYGQLLYPSIGLRTPGEIVEANFGHRPFRFDISTYFKETKAKVWAAISQVPLPLLSTPQRQSHIQNSTTNSAAEAGSPPPAESAQAAKPGTPPPATRSVLNDLVLSYLIHQGYTDTAEAFAQGTGAPTGQSLSSREPETADVDMLDINEGSSVSEEETGLDSQKKAGGLHNEAWMAASLTNREIKNRQKIRDFIMDGSIRDAVEMINKFYPAVLDHPVPLPMLSKASTTKGAGNLPTPQELAVPPVSFFLKVRQFIDFVGLMAQRSAVGGPDRADDPTKQPAATPRTTRSKVRAEATEKVEDFAAEDRMILSTPHRPRPPSNEPDDLMDDSEDAMDLDTQGSARSSKTPSAIRTGNGGMAGSGIRSTRQSRRVEVGEGIGPATPSRRSRPSRTSPTADQSEDSLLQQVMALGQELQNEFGRDEREPFRSTLQECFSLLAYSDPYNSPLAYLLESGAREPVANMVNSVILAVQGKPPLSPLEVLYRQTAVALDELVKHGVAAASFVNLRKDCLL